MSIFAHTREAVRVKVKKNEPNLPPEWRKFSVDPQITSLEVLYSLLAKAFDIRSDFSIKYKAFDPAGNEIYLPVLSDWDLDAAFLRIHNVSIQTSSEPCLMLQIDIKPFTEVKEWDPDACLATITSNSTGSTPTAATTRELISPLQQSFGVSQKYVQQMHTKLPGLIMNQMEKTFSIVQKAFNLSDETMAALPPRPPLADGEFRQFLDALGQIQRSDELRKVIFFGGIDPSLRRVVWKHILNVYPSGMNGHQRMEYIRRKSEHYYKLRETWKNAVKQGFVAGELSYVTSMVKKDVLRTDRLHPFYAGSDDNQNIGALFNILTTYALNHPTVSYCQGMSDIASPLLVTMNDEAQAYICFCAIMSRVRGNFLLDGIAMTQKFAHLTEALSFYDSEFWEYLKSQQADDLLFCYRWLLLEMKREFPFEDALRMLEVQWSSLKYEKNVDKELQLFEQEFVPSIDNAAPNTPSSVIGVGPPISPPYLLSKPRENAYTKVCAIRRQSSSASLSSLTSSVNSSVSHISSTSNLDGTRRLNQSLDDNFARQSTRRHCRPSSKAHQSLDETKIMQIVASDENAQNKNGKSSNIKPADDNGKHNEFDDDVFTDDNYFNFHDTNPFKDDSSHSPVLSDINKDYKLSRKHQIPKAFLSSSSSLVTDETSSCGPSSECNSPADLKDKKTGQIPKGIAKLQNKNILSNYTAVSNIIAKQLANATTVSESVKRVSSTGGGHFKDLKEKIAATSRKGLSLDDCTSEKSQQKLVKNFNEFLNFTSVNKSRVAATLEQQTMLSTAKEVTSKSKSPSPSRDQTALYTQRSTSPTTATVPTPLVQLTKNGLASSLDESDSSSIPDTTNNTTWGCSTAATAIQQTNNLSSNSLQLDLNSLSSLTQTPERTPIIERKSYSTTCMSQTEADYTINAISTELQAAHNDTMLDSQTLELDEQLTKSITQELRKEAEILEKQVLSSDNRGMLKKKRKDFESSEIEYEKLGKDSIELIYDLKESDGYVHRNLKSDLINKSKTEKTISKENCTLINGEINSNSNENISDLIKLNPFLDASSVLTITPPVNSRKEPSSESLPEVLMPISTDIPNAMVDEMGTTAAEEEVSFSKMADRNASFSMTSDAYQLPPPSEFGGGNPFLMFLCLTLLLQHRNTIMKTNMDYNEIAMHFDKMVRKHDVTRVLNQARRMYIDYLKTQASHSQEHDKLQQKTKEKIAQHDPNRNGAAVAATTSPQLASLQSNFSQHSNQKSMSTFTKS